MGGSNGFDGAGKVFGATIAKIIAGDGGDNDMFQAHPGDGFGDSCWFIGFEGEGFGGGDGTEATGSGAAVASDHEGGGACAPAFPAVWALGFLADGV